MGARKGLAPFVKSLSLPDTNQLPPRPDASLPHPHLSIQHGVACRRCTFRSTTMDLVRRHLSKVHHLKDDRQTWLRDSICDGLDLQSWTQNGSRKLWVVTDDKPLPLDSTAAEARCSPRRRRRVAELHEEQEQRIAAEDRER